MIVLVPSYLPSAALGRWSGSEAQCVTGHWAEDATILMGHANALLDLRRWPEAFARAYEGLGRNAEADDAYCFAADRVPGMGAAARYVAFMTNTGRREDAEIGMTEIERRMAKVAGPLRGEARVWRDMAAKALAGGDR